MERYFLPICGFLFFPAICSDQLIFSLIVYNAIASAQSGHVGRRLENLFWRIWGSRRRHDTLRGSTVAKLFLKISQTSPLPGIPVQQPKQVGNNHGNVRDLTFAFILGNCPFLN